MDKKTTSIVTDEDLAAAFEGPTNEEGNKKQKTKSSEHGKKQCLIFSIVGGVCFLAGIVCLLVALFGINTEQTKLEYPNIPSKTSETETYSALTGEPLAEGVQIDASAYCIQTPNGTDGARPQAGLDEAGVVFEAIAEAGITRFAAIYQDPASAVIGPIRSLRIYYLQWDTPFDCTIVHAGGADDALAAVSRGGYKDLDESYTYMYRGTYGERRWNNLFTTSASLKKFSSNSGKETSKIQGFARLTPSESERQRADESVTTKLNITEPTEENTSDITVPVPTINLNLGGWAAYNVKYDYDAESNTYLRGYANGAAHEVYTCEKKDMGERNPEDICKLTQMAPSVVVAMMVQETKAADNYHENITAIGSGNAYVFQNGTAIKGTWKKPSAEDQIKFEDENGKEIKLAPGQTFVTAVPNYGSVDF